MPGRNGKPIQLIKSEGNKRHLTKAEIEHREKFEQALYTGIKFKERKSVKEDPVAHKEFLRLRKLYKHIQYVDGLDEAIINRYCLLTSKEQALQKLLDRMNDDIDDCEDFKDRMALYKTISGTLAGINKVRDMILKLEDRLFLNPTARIKSIPKKPKDEDENDPMAAYLSRKNKAGG